jgi:tetraacyldisaccharide 4'-kinase
MKHKFPSITVAVDKKRTHGIECLTASAKAKDSVDVILLDDAFQHRYVKPGVNILLVDYHRLIIYDKLLPAGRLREPLTGKNRADIVIITKCPKALKPMEYRVITRAMNLYPYQQLYFTSLEYDNLQPVFPKHQRAAIPSDLTDYHVLLVTGIASPRQLLEDLTPKAKSIKPLTFSDHHNFNRKDIRLLNEAFADMPSPKIIITTEKDATRLTCSGGLSADVCKNIYAQPIRVSFMLNQEQAFNDHITGYIMKNSRNSILIRETPKTKSAEKKQKDKKPKTISFR